MRIIGTGLSGFIGKHLVNRLITKRHEVHHLGHEDIGKFKTSGFDYFFFLSSYGNHYDQDDDRKTFKANVVDLFNLLDKTRNIDYKGFIHFSTSSVLLEHQTLYSATKSAGEKICRAFADKYDKPIISVRPLSVYGPEEADFRFIPTIVRNVLHNDAVKVGDGVHDWIYVDDLIDGLEVVMQYAHEIKEPVNIGTGVNTSNHDVYEKVVSYMGIPARKLDVGLMRKYDTSYWIADTSLIRKYGWGAKTRFDEGVKMTVDYYKQKYGF